MDNGREIKRQAACTRADGRTWYRKANMLERRLGYHVDHPDWFCSCIHKGLLSDNRSHYVLDSPELVEIAIKTSVNTYLVCTSWNGNDKTKSHMRENEEIRLKLTKNRRTIVTLVLCSGPRNAPPVQCESYVTSQAIRLLSPIPGVKTSAWEYGVVRRNR